MAAAVNHERSEQGLSHITGHKHLLSELKEAFSENGIKYTMHKNEKSGKIDSMVIDFEENNKTLLNLAVNHRVSDLTAIPTAQKPEELKKFIVENLKKRMEKGEEKYFYLAKGALQHIVEKVQFNHPQAQAVVTDAFHETRFLDPERGGLGELVKYAKASRPGISREDFDKLMAFHKENAGGKQDYYSLLTPKGFKVVLLERERTS